MNLIEVHDDEPALTKAGLDALLTMAPRELGFVRRMATIIGAAFVACALVYMSR
jgi:hypothetical protein